MRHEEATFSVPPRSTLSALLAVAVWVCLGAPQARADTLAQKKAEARSQFEKAEGMRTELQGLPSKQRSFDRFTRTVSAYHHVYLITPQATQVTAALVAEAELYQQMGRQFDSKYFQWAIDTYKFLLDQYPNTRHREDALFTIALIQREDLNQFTAAQKTFQEFLRRFPQSAKADQARQSLAELAEVGRKESRNKPRQELAEQIERDRKLPRVTSIRHWNAENYTRVVIDLENSVKFQAARIPNPDRIYFDIYAARLSPALSGSTQEVGDGFLKAIRVAQNQTGVVRVVLDADKVKDYSAFLLPNPYRLVIDVRGEGAVLAKAESRTPTPATEDPNDGTRKSPKPPKSEPSVASIEVAGAQTPSSQPEKPTSRSERPADHSAVTTPSQSAVPPPPQSSPASGELTAGQPPVLAASRGHSLKPDKAEAAEMRTVPEPQPTRAGEHSLTRTLGLKIGRIVIDPGHGGHDTGTIGPSGLMEKDLCLDVALRLGKLIQARLPGAEVIYTRRDDTFVPLESRTAIANQEKADLFLSIHANSSQDRHARGVETYYLNFAASPEALQVAARENALSQSGIHELQDLIRKIAKNDKIEESRELAGDLQSSLVSQLTRGRSGMKSRGVKKAPFVVLIGANMPSALAEISFLSNPTDERLLKKPDQRARVAEGLFTGVQTYLASLNSLSYNTLPKASGSSAGAER